MTQKPLKNVFLKFLDRAKIEIYDKNGKTTGIKGSLYNKTAIFNNIFRKIPEGFFPRFEKLKIFVREEGKKDPTDDKKCHLRVLVAKPGKKTLSGKSENQLVTACKKCDGILLDLEDGTREIDLEHCPYCNGSMEHYWRLGKIFETEFCYNETDWSNAIYKKFLQYYDKFAYIPIYHRKLLRPATINLEDCANFIVFYSKLCPNSTLGPFKLEAPPSGISYWKSSWISIAYGKAIHPFAYKHPLLPEAYLFSKEKITPKNSIYNPNVSMNERIERAEEALNALEQKIQDKLDKQEEAGSAPEIYIDYGNIAEDFEFNSTCTLANVYFSMSRTKRGVNNAQYYVNMHKADGIRSELIARFEKRKITKTLSELRFTNNSLEQLMGEIQNTRLFEQVTFYVLESSVQYGDSEPHYYLKPVINTPGKKIKISKSTRKVKACDECDTMLLNYSFDWVMQKEDLKEKKCPYCQKTLYTRERERKLVPVTLDYKAKDLQITGTNNQIGALYNGLPVKLTVKVKSLFDFLQNYQVNFPNKVMGPFNIKIDFLHSRGKITHIEYGIFEEEIEWRPIILFPEDLIAF